MTRFIKFIPSSNADFLQENHPNAFLLLCLIAKRARRTSGELDGLKVGDALLGDYKTAGLSRQQYRTALDKLVEMHIVEIIYNGKTFLKREKSTIKITIKGMLVNLKDSSIWDINAEESNQHINQRATNEQPTSNHEQERIRKNKKEKEEHTQGECDSSSLKEKISQKPKEFIPSTYTSVPYKPQTEKKSYGELGLVNLYESEYEKLISKDGLDELQRDYWIEQVESTMQRKGVEEFNKQNQSHYYAIKAWISHRKSNQKIVPIPAAEFISINKNQLSAEHAEKNYTSSTHQIQRFYNRLEINSKGYGSKVDILYFDENGFEDKLKSLLTKMKFERIKLRERA